MSTSSRSDIEMSGSIAIASFLSDDLGIAGVVTLRKEDACPVPIFYITLPLLFVGASWV